MSHAPVSPVGLAIMNITRHSSAFLTGFLLFMSGCGAQNKPVPLVDLRAGAKAAAPEAGAETGNEILIWGRMGEGDDTKPTTYRLADGSGRLISEEQGISILTRNGEMVWHEEQIDVKTVGCSFDENAPSGGGSGTITRVWLAPKDEGSRQKVVEPGDFSDAQLNEIQHSVQLLGSVGPLLFVHDDSYSYACGAHGGVSAGFLIWDADAGAQVEMLNEVPNQQALAKLAEKKLNEEDGGAEGDDLPTITQIMPVYAGRGGMHVEAQFTRFACYACSDGLWSSYTRSTVVPTDWMPARLAAWAMPPIAVKEFLETHPSFKLGGWSRK